MGLQSATAKAPVRRAIAAVGRRRWQGRAIASFLASYIAINFDPRGKLRPGERAVVICLACDRGQASIVFNYIRGYFETIGALKAMVTHCGADSLDLSNNVTIEVHTNSFRGVRGKTLLCVIFDEVAFWRDENFSNPDVEMEIAVRPGLARVIGSMLIMISSVHKRAGLLYSNQKSLFGKDIDDAMMVMGSTLKFNPSFDADLIARDLAADPERFGAEYECKYRDDISSFISRDLLDACTDKGVVVRSPEAGCPIRGVLRCQRRSQRRIHVGHRASARRTAGSFLMWSVGASLRSILPTSLLRLSRS